jgi:hypothetical protein
VVENKVLRRIFGPKENELTRGWRMHDEEVLDLCSSPSIIIMIKSRRMRWAWNVARIGGRGIHVFSVKPEGKRPLGNPSCRLVDNIKQSLGEIV